MKVVVFETRQEGRPAPEGRDRARTFHTAGRDLINTAALARCKAAPSLSELFQQFVSRDDKPLKRLSSWSSRQPRAEAPVLMRTSRRPLSARGRRGDGGERGVALVITLIMLSVITFMAVAFLVLSRGERTSVSTATDQAVARLAADNALERVQAELVAPMQVSGNYAGAGLLVSTNYINSIGFRTGISNPTNVSYVDISGKPLTGNDMLQNLNNLIIDPRPPVYITTNRLTAASDFRYYLDLNRNGMFDPSGLIQDTNKSGVALNSFESVQGDPQWIGVLEFPDRNHSADNRFLSRFAYVAVPISQGLDINYIHNAARNPGKTTIDTTGADFLRNQGVGTWEINLASFLYDLNTNTYAWGGPYIYNPLANTVIGNSFVDACSILTNRYGGFLSYQSRLSSVRNLFGLAGPAAFANHAVDGYTAGPLMTGASGFNYDPDVNPVARSSFAWPGADNTNHFFSSQDFFDPAKTSPSFVARLQATSTNVDTYDRYTFYRLLSQLGTDSAPEPPNKLNLNYDNKVQRNLRGIVSATNFFAWKPVDFFTNAANMLLTNAGLNLSLTNLQVYPTNYYTPSVHRLLQLAANIYDSSTNRALLAGQTNRFFPSVFRPIFRRYNSTTNVVITIVGYREVLYPDMAAQNTSPAMIDPTVTGANLSQIPALGTPFAQIFAPGQERTEPLISGIPLIIGAKQGFPNFNEFAMETQVYVSRLLEFRRAAADVNSKGPVVQTNQMYVVGISNVVGLEAWNSYRSSYPRDLRLITTVGMTAIVTNELGFGTMVYSNKTNLARTMDIAANTWKGWTDKSLAPYAMQIPLTNSFSFLTNSTYIPRPPWFVQQTHEFQRGSGFYVPHWWLNLNTRLQFILLDTTVQPNRIVDYVNLNNWESTIDITTKLTEGNTAPINPGDYRNIANQWLTNHLGNNLNAPTYGVINQIQVGLNGTTDWLSFSQDPYSGQDAESAVDGFRNNLLDPPGSPIYPKDAGKIFYRSNVFYAPFAPYRPIYIHTTWQANDPLVHYTIGDLIDPLNFIDTNRVNFNHIDSNIGQINGRYKPWGGNPNKNDPLTDFQMAVKDPSVTRSDDWDFPGNKYPNIGWLGRVHRGTPWQTVFLKSTNTMQVVGGPKGFAQSLLNWQLWSGNPITIGNPVLTNMVSSNLVVSLVGTNVNARLPDAVFTSPTNDWHILDLFTTAFNDNAGRGQLSVNQPNLAAWSAVLAGVSVLPNLSMSNVFILPSGADSLARVQKIVTGINNTRTNFPNNAFPRLGDVLATPELTMGSPYLLSTNRAQIINDAVVERIPQQILGLLHGGEQPPRYVIYSYGQTLKPAPKSFVMTSGPYFGMCTNYTITAEVATRAVVHIEGAPNKPRTVVESFNVLPPD